MQKKILINGSNGFIGKNLYEQLQNDFTIFSPIHDKLDLLNEKELFKFLNKHRFDVIIHCATHNSTLNSKKDLSLVLHNNLLMYFNLAKQENLYGRMIYFGSGAEYDRKNTVPKIKEDYFNTYIPIDDYGFSKYIISKFTEKSKNIYNLRLFGCFGKYEDWEIRFISNACCKALFNMDITIKQNVYFDYLYINDLVKIVRWFINVKNIKYHSYNICTGKSIDLITIAKKIIQISNKSLEIKVKKMGLKNEYSGDNTRLLKEINSFDFTPIDTAIKEVYYWYKENKSIIDKNLLLFDK